jgi:hypothetical protein
MSRWGAAVAWYLMLQAFKAALRSSSVRGKFSVVGGLGV